MAAQAGLAVSQLIIRLLFSQEKNSLQRQPTSPPLPPGIQNKSVYSSGARGHFNAPSFNKLYHRSHKLRLKQQNGRNDTPEDAPSCAPSYTAPRLFSGGSGAGASDPGRRVGLAVGLKEAHEGEEAAIVKAHPRRYHGFVQAQSSPPVSQGGASLRAQRAGRERGGV